MNSAPQYQADTWKIGAGESLEIARAAEFLVCLEASAPFKITFDHGTKTNFEAGLSFKVPGGFSHVRIENPGASEISVRLGFGRGDLRDARLVLDGAVHTESISAPVFLAPGPVSIAAGAVSQLVTDDLERRELAIKNTDETETIWVKDQSDVGASGWPLGPSEGLVLTTSAAVYAFNPSASSVSVAIFETKGA
ncbi:hypothetical protein AB9K35_01250 [Leisingera sp. XS_AS12]|uniref:hypothetical protein n=1 Tax=Leisingera sp. XS_AS12 TaxID=3241294 RepID=UPI0035174610